MKKILLFLIIGVLISSVTAVKEEASNEDEDKEDNGVKRTIICESGRYVNGVLMTYPKLNKVECHTHNKVRPACETKVEERVNYFKKTTVVWKECKTVRSCNRNAGRINPRHCPVPKRFWPKSVRICVTCCHEDNCNQDHMKLDDVEGYDHKKKNNA